MVQLSQVRYKRYINLPMLLRVIGWLLLIEAAFLVIPMVVSFCYREADALPFLWGVLISGGVGLGLTFLRPESKEMGKREAILLTTLIWIIFSFFGMIPLSLSGYYPTFTDAFFDTISGFTSTGLSALSSVEGLPHGILLWRCISQWIGGLGIILFTLAVIPMLNYQGGMQLFKAEVANVTSGKLRPRVSQTAMRIWVIYIALTLVLVGLLFFSEMQPFDAICHALTTISTGGFSTYDYSIYRYASVYIKIVTLVFMFLGSVNFTLIYAAVHGDFSPIRKNDALRWYLWIILIMSVCYSYNIIHSGVAKNVSDVLLDPIFQSVSILSTTGIIEPDFHLWGPVSIILLIVTMMCGSCAGSTSGGIKIDRVIIMFKHIRNEFYRMMHPNSIKTVIINGTGTTPALVQKVMVFLALYMLVILMGGTIITAMGVPLHNAFMYTLSAITNTALGPDPTGEFGTYYHLSSAIKWIISFLMLAGRLELYTVLLIFTPVFWRD